MSKPAGTVYGGRISMNKRGYGDWKRRADASLEALTGPLPHLIDPRYGWVIVHTLPKVNGGDLLNHVGSTMDTLVRRKVVQDDAPRWVSRVFTSFVRGTPAGIVIYICETREEFTELLCELA